MTQQNTQVDNSLIKKAVHYNRHDVECIELIVMLPPTLSNVIKYMWRYKDKGTALVDLNKALEYFELHKKFLQDEPLPNVKGIKEIYPRVSALHFETKQRWVILLTLDYLMSGTKSLLLDAEEVVRQLIMEECELQNL